MSRRVADLALGVRLSVAGGRSAWARLALIAVGVGMGVAVLLVSTTLPALLAARSDRGDARSVDFYQDPPAGPDTLLVAEADSTFRDRDVYGRLLQPEGPAAPLPPGVDRLPGPGEMVASPALAELLASPEGELLRGRWNERVVGTIGPEGVTGPAEYAFYLGTDGLTPDNAYRIDSFGRAFPAGGVTPILLLALVGLVVLLLPVAIFVATAVRFGGEARDRQLAALRLVGADAAVTRRIAAGEALVGALLGLAVGAGLFWVVGLAVHRWVPPTMSFHLADLRPVPALAGLVLVGVPVAAVLVTLTALRRVVVEPLGVVRHSGTRHRRLWWRLVLPVLGLVLLYPLTQGLEGRGTGFEFRVVAGVSALLVGVALLLPWLVEATVRRLGGGGVAWELAVRRLQVDNGTAVRTVSGIAVAVAGAIALQGLLAAVQTEYTEQTGGSTETYQALVAPSYADTHPTWERTLGEIPEVGGVGTMRILRATVPGEEGDRELMLRVGDCAVLRQFATLDSCADGDAFRVAEGTAPDPGTPLALGGAESPGARWTLPPATRTVHHPAGQLVLYTADVLVTPAALGAATLPSQTDVSHYVTVAATPDALDRIRNVVAKVDPGARVQAIEAQRLAGVLVAMRQGLFVGAVALLLLIGASMLVNLAEQLRERRRLLAVLVAFGTRRSTLTGSILYQVAMPVLLGLTLAVVIGGGLALILQTVVAAPLRLDWAGIALTAGAATLVVLGTTAASLPLLWRLTRPAGLRSE